MATPAGCFLAEAYVSMKAHKEKMKKIQEDGAKIEGTDDHLDEKKSSGSVSWTAKKIHCEESSQALAVDHAGKESKKCNIKE